LNFDSKIAYCTNVHPGIDLAGVKANLLTFTLAVRQSLLDSGDWQPDEQLGVGLWLADSAAREVLEGDNLRELADWLQTKHLLPFTFNGFPQSNFHQPVVKHRVYEPTWWQAERFEYTRRLIQILDGMLPPGQIGSISTLPISWSSPQPTHDQKKQAASYFKQIAIELDRLMQSSHREIVLAIEPEPGCAITDGPSMRAFFDEFLLDDSHQEIVRRHITVCHDVCHAAVMQESQTQEIKSYRERGIRIGKVQVSSAIEVNWGNMDATERNIAFLHLSRFAEDRYLHQTTVVKAKGGPCVLHEDLPALIEATRAPGLLQGVWRVHFHVPIFYEKAGPLGTTQNDIRECIHTLSTKALAAPVSGHSQAIASFTGHLEVETYAWSVLPESHRGASLAEDIATELRYLKRLVEKKVFPQPDKSVH